MNQISIESLFLKYPTSMISDALDEIDINGAISGVFPQRYDQGRISGRALPVKFNKKSSDPEAWRFGGGGLCGRWAVASLSRCKWSWKSCSCCREGGGLAGASS